MVVSLASKIVGYFLTTFDVNSSWMRFLAAVAMPVFSRSDGVA